jgi:hypothetical protein
MPHLLLLQEAQAFILSIKGPSASSSYEEMVAKIYAFERQIYGSIQEELLSFDSRAPEESAGKALGRIYDAMGPLVAILPALFDAHVAYPGLCFYEFNHALLPDSYKVTPEQYFCAQYHYFMNECLSFPKKTDLAEKNNIAVYVRCLLSRPVGQELIVRLNNYAQLHRCRIAVCINGSTSSLAVEPDVIGLPESAHSSAGWFSVNKKASNQPKLHVPLTYEKHGIWIQNDLSFGKYNSLVFKPRFISFGHELVHVLRCFNGDFTVEKISGKYDDPAINFLFMCNAEELNTIDLAEISENKLRIEYGFSERFSHISALQHSYGDTSLEGIQKTMIDVRAHLGLQSQVEIEKVSSVGAEEVSLQVPPTVMLTEDFSVAPPRQGCCTLM